MEIIEFLSLSLSIIAVLIAIFFNKTEEMNNNDKFNRIVIFSSTIIGLLSIFIIAFYQMFFIDHNVPEQYTDKLFDMQSITLTVTGISVSLISIISTVLTSRREQKYDNLQKKYEEENNKIEEIIKTYDEYNKELSKIQKKIGEEMNHLSDILTMNNVFLPKRKIRLLNQLSHSSDSFLEKFVYMKTLHDKYNNNESNENKNIYYLQIINDGEILLKNYDKICNDSEIHKTQKYMVILMVADAYFFLAENYIYESSTLNDESILKNLESSEKYLSMADGIFFDEDGYVENSRGLLDFWRYKYFSSRQDMDKDKKILLLDSAINHYKSAIDRNSIHSNYHNNLGVAYLQKANETIDENDNLYFASLSFRKSLSLDAFAAKAALNIADIEIRKIRYALNIEDEIIIFQSKKKLVNYDNVDISSYLRQGKKYFDYAISIDPHFVNSYYKKAQLLVYELFYKKVRNGSEDTIGIETQINDLFNDADNVNDGVMGTLYIKRMYFDISNRLDDARKVNEKISEKYSANAKKWLDALEKN